MFFDLFMKDICPRCRKPIKLAIYRATFNSSRHCGLQVRMRGLRGVKTKILFRKQALPPELAA